MKGLPRRFEQLFHTPEGKDILNNHYIIAESELRHTHASTTPVSSHGRLIHGVQRFYAERQQNDKRLFDFLADKQDPHTLFIACSDSRIIPSQITSSDPGELFIIRNVGNVIPTYEENIQHSEAAALEFALTQLNIHDIVICGHTNCGAIKASCSSSNNSLQPELQQWINKIRTQLHLKENKNLDDFAMDNVLNQVNNLKQYPIVKAKLASHSLNIHAWFFNFDQNMIYEWDSQLNKFNPVINIQ
jgi:carbonic anhydrase